MSKSGGRTVCCARADFSAVGLAIATAAIRTKRIAEAVKSQSFVEPKKAPVTESVSGFGAMAISPTRMNSATVRSMVTEPIISIDFKDGQYMQKGQLRS
jgi:multidrug efflux pump subunit AcrA (membrane-fusion protein)